MFDRAELAGGHVKKGEKGLEIVFTKRIRVTDNDDEERQILMLRAFTVFNVAQMEGIESSAVIPPHRSMTSARICAGMALIEPAHEFATRFDLQFESVKFHRVFTVSLE
jgi:antirestriction protein ArdC